MKALVGAFNQEKALVGAFSVIVQLHRLIDLRRVTIIGHSAPEQWPSEKKTSTPKINPNESVLQLYIDI